MPNAVVSPRVRSRRRGAALRNAIYAAALAELSATGYARMTMEGVAERARTGKAALYRRWSSKEELVLDALHHALPDGAGTIGSGAVREELIRALTAMSDVLGGHAPGPALRFEVLGELLRAPALREAFADRIVTPRLAAIESLLRRAVEGGEIPAHTSVRLVARTGPALIIQSFLLTGAAPPAGDIVEIVDRVVMPLLDGTAAAPGVA